MRIKRRRQLGRLLNNLGLMGPSAEIGVHRGQFAKNWLSRWKGSLLYCVDPWIFIGGYDDALNRQQRDEDHAVALRNLAPFGDRVRVLRMLSHDAAQTIRQRLDCVYLDADHSYDAVRSDIESWWPLIRKGGILGGHDYHFNGRVKVPNGSFLCGVKQAVDEFVEREELTLVTTHDEFERNDNGEVVKAPSWFVRKS